MIDEIEVLEEELRKLSGISRKLAKRISMALVDRNNNDLLAAIKAVEHVKDCEICNNLTTAGVCDICADPDRDDTKICVVTTVTDLMRIEDGGFFTGKYFVIKQNINPKKGVGPSDIFLDKIELMIDSSTELILATDATIEGQLTANFLRNKFENTVKKVSKLSTGIPLGASIDYLDIETIKAAFNDRKNY